MTETAPVDWVPAECSLPTQQHPLRVAELDELLSHATALDRVGPTVLTVRLDAAPGTEELVRDLVRRETGCCSFFTFSLDRVEPATLLLTVSVPPTQVQVLDGIAARAGQLPRTTA
ncbi:hypothetical protein [Aquipuribacter hungaricus]|uniref:Arsenate reductase n=1 Tax=Aquipuribacter hungaricus TaxID=545624 RepID=A0ABV7WJX9_9MICO